MIVRRCALGCAIAALVTSSVAPAQQLPLPAPQASVQPADAQGAYQPQDKDERGLWMEMEESERQVRTSNFVIHDPAINAYVHDVFCRTVGPRCSEIRIYLMRTPYFNATTAPNGMMQIWSGLLLRVRNEAQLSAVLAHEFIHYQDRHSLALFRQAKSKSSTVAWMSVFGLGLFALGEIGALYKFSRDQESEADTGSLGLMAKAGYDPREAGRIWEQFRAEADATAEARKVKSRKDKDRGMFATHPPSAERVASLNALAAKMTVPPTASIGRSEYQAALGRWWASLIDDQVKLNDFGGTEYLIGNLASEGWTPSLNYARGELYRSRGRPEDLTAAVGFYRSASAAPDAPVECWRGLGLSLLRSGAQADGQAALKIYLTRKPDASDKALIAMMAGG
ncbi:M48 family metallopeptidase [Sphingomonas sp. RT2P30]|uniref:M48 family metallopeptidase n=1 Tax=Parasphingomonas halimpatiens TaxID=3096162 RepID=UPI002FCA8482